MPAFQIDASTLACAPPLRRTPSAGMSVSPPPPQVAGHLVHFLWSLRGPPLGPGADATLALGSSPPHPIWGWWIEWWHVRLERQLVFLQMFPRMAFDNNRLPLFSFVNRLLTISKRFL